MQLLNRLIAPNPLRRAALSLTRRLELGTFTERLELGALERPHYAHCLYHGALLAKRLGLARISTIEMGVAGGSGLVTLERYAAEIERLLSINIDVYGFDSGEGLFEPADYRDVPHYWKSGSFRMDVPKLTSRLTRAQLVLGDVRDTVERFFREQQRAPIAALMMDLDYYSSTAAGLRLFEAAPEHYLPRVQCYFDDIIGDELSAFNDFAGQRLAVREFNERHARKKLCPAPYLLAREVPARWHHKVFVLHDFEHPQYNVFVGPENAQLPLREGAGP